MYRKEYNIRICRNKLLYSFLFINLSMKNKLKLMLVMCSRAIIVSLASEDTVSVLIIKQFIKIT